MDTRQHSSTARRRQGIYWIATIPYSDWRPELLTGINWLKGQRERGVGGFEHWQVLIGFAAKKSMEQAKQLLGCPTAHLELTRSAAADAYVWKDDTSLGERFELGRKPFKRNDPVDWDLVRTSAIAGDFDNVPSDVYVRYYGNLQRICADHLQPVAIERKCYVYWGETGTGKSRAAWDEAGLSAYSKDPRTKFWCGYAGQQHVVVDEFRGGIDISHVLRWLDRYPVRVEIKGASRPLVAETFWITSNMHPASWYPELDRATFLALERRLIIKQFG